MQIYKNMIDHFFWFFGKTHEVASLLDNSKIFAGCAVLLLNLLGRSLQISFSKSLEEHLKNNVSKFFIFFLAAWMGSRSIIVALFVTAVFAIISEIWFNEDHEYCIIPHQYRVLNKLNNLDTNGDGEVSAEEYSNAIAVLEKAKKEKERKNQKDIYMHYHYTLNNN